MNFTLAFLLSSYLMIFLGLLGLIYTGELSWSYILVTLVSLGAGVVIDLRGTKGVLPGMAANLAMIAIFVLTSVSIFVLGAAPIQELVHFLLALQAVKILTPKKTRDWLQLYLLSFFSVVASSALSVELSFAAIFFCYLFLAPWVLILLQLKEASEAAGKDLDSGTAPVNLSLVGLAGGTGMALFVLTVFFFLTFPRLSVRLFADSWASGSAVTGFSDSLTLGQVAEIQRNSAIAMRIGTDRSRIPHRAPYWRGMILDFFDGRRWRKSKTQSVFLPRRGDAYLAREGTAAQENLLRQSIILEPNGSTALFALGRVTALSGRLGTVYRDSLGNLRLAYAPPFQISYEVTSDTRETWLDEFPNASSLQLPPLDSRISALAHTVTGTANLDEKRAHLLERFLKDTYQYSLEGLPVGSDDPLSAFLFNVRKGNCEYFASSLAVMLRSLGISARVVTGYLGGEWNPYGEYYLVRQSDAHSWVEAFLPGKGWVTLDPTPSLPPGTRRSVSAATLFFDSLQVRWYRYVVNFGFADQQQLFTALRQPNHWFDAALSVVTLNEFKPSLSKTQADWMQVLAAAVGTALALLVLWKYFGGRFLLSPNPSHQATERYQRFLTLIGKKVGLSKGRAETPDEFGQKATAGGVAGVEELTRLYQQARFSGNPARAELKRMDEILEEMKNI